jgi:hypothetical protein
MLISEMLKKMKKKNLKKKLLTNMWRKKALFVLLASTPQKIFLKKSKKVCKNAEFHADFRNVERFVQKCTKKKL